MAGTYLAEITCGLCSKSFLRYKTVFPDKLGDNFCDSCMARIVEAGVNELSGRRDTRLRDMNGKIIREGDRMINMHGDEYEVYWDYDSVEFMMRPIGVDETINFPVTLNNLIKYTWEKVS